MKKKGYLRSLERKQEISGMRIVGIDPAKESHQASVVDERCMQVGTSFSFQTTYEGYNKTLRGTTCSAPYPILFSPANPPRRKTNWGMSRNFGTITSLF